MKKSELRAKFKEFYKNEISGNIEEFENIRKQAIAPIIGTSMMLVGIILACFRSLFEAGFIVSLIGVLILYKSTSSAITPHNMEKVNSQLKDRFMAKFLAIFGDFAWLDQPDLLLGNYFEKSHILLNTSCLQFDDVFQGTYEDVKIEIFEALFSLKSTRFFFLSLVFVTLGIIILVPIFAFIFWDAFILLLIPVLLIICVPIFFVMLFISALIRRRGVIIKCKFNKKFRFNTYLTENNFVERLLNREKGYMKRVYLEDTNFDKKYLVFSQDQVEARYLLTTAFMYRFQNIKTAFKALYTRAEFTNGELTIFIRTNKNLFSVANFSKNVTYEAFSELFEEMYSILHLIDLLKLNQKINL